VLGAECVPRAAVEVLPPGLPHLVRGAAAAAAADAEQPLDGSARGEDDAFLDEGEEGAGGPPRCGWDRVLALRLFVHAADREGGGALLPTLAPVWRSSFMKTPSADFHFVASRPFSLGEAFHAAAQEAGEGEAEAAAVAAPEATAAAAAEAGAPEAAPAPAAQDGAEGGAEAAAAAVAEELPVAAAAPAPPPAVSLATLVARARAAAAASTHTALAPLRLLFSAVETISYAPIFVMRNFNFISHIIFIARPAEDRFFSSVGIVGSMILSEVTTRRVREWLGVPRDLATLPAAEMSESGVPRVRLPFAVRAANGTVVPRDSADLVLHENIASTANNFTIYEGSAEYAVLAPLVWRALAIRARAVRGLAPTAEASLVERAARGGSEAGEGEAAAEPAAAAALLARSRTSSCDVGSGARALSDALPRGLPARLYAMTCDDAAAADKKKAAPPRADASPGGGAPATNGSETEGVAATPAAIPPARSARHEFFWRVMPVFRFAALSNSGADGSAVANPRADEEEEEEEGPGGDGVSAARLPPHAAPANATAPDAAPYASDG
jgi:hypothetical protein